MARANAPIRSGRSSKARTEADTSSGRHPSPGVRFLLSQASVQPSSLPRAVAHAGDPNSTPGSPSCWRSDRRVPLSRTIAGRRLRSPRDPRRGDRVRHGAIVPAARLAPPPGRLQNFDRRRRRAGADVCFEGWVLAAAWIGASDGAACGPRNPARATPRRPALLIAGSRAREAVCRSSGLHMQGASGGLG